MSCDCCASNQFEIIKRAKEDILDSTNIFSSPEEMKVLNDFLFRCWQMGWLGRYDYEHKKENSNIDFMTNFKFLKNYDACSRCQYYNKHIPSHTVCENPHPTECLWNTIEHYIKLGKMLSKMYMTKINDDYVFKFDNLSDEEKSELDRLWCNG